MKLNKLDLETYMQAIIQVNKQMADEEENKKLLDAAIQDTPIINDLLIELRKLYELDECPEKEKGIQTAQRDLTVLLALRAIDRGEF